MADNIIDIHPLDLGAIIEADEDCVDIIQHNDGTIEVPAGSGKLYRLTVDVAVTSLWGKQVVEDAKHVDLRQS